MPRKEKYHEIIDKVRKTFDILRDMFLETPLEPFQPPRGLALTELKDLPSPDGIELAVSDRTERKARLDRIQGAPARAVEPLSETHQKYLETILADYEYVCLSGFFPDGKSLKVPREKVYQPPSLMDKRIGAIRPERDDGFYGGAAALSVASALQRYRRVVIIGSPGCGKTSLLISLLLAYTRSLGGERFSRAGQDATRITAVSKQRLLAAEDNHLPILVSLRELGLQLKEKYPRSVKDVPARLLDFLMDSTPSPDGSGLEKIFNEHLTSGKAIVLMDGLDEVADARLRQRVARLIEKFVKSFPNCRYIVTSRPFVYDNAALLGEQFGTLQIREFNPSEAYQFARAFSVTVETGLAGVETPDVLGQAKQRSEKLISAIDGSLRIAELAVSPQSLSMLAMVQRQRNRWPEHRIDLYEAVLDVLLDQRLADLRSDPEPGLHSLDRTEVRKTLEMLAFWLHQQNRCEIKRSDLSALLMPWFLQRHAGDEAFAERAVDAFLLLTGADSGLFVEPRVGVVSYSQRTFQEVLAANALAEKQDTLAYMRKCLPVLWWREVILFEAGVLNRQAGHRVSEMIQFILDTGSENGMKNHQSIFLAADCLLDLDLKHLETGLIDEVGRSLKKLVNLPAVRLTGRVY